MASSSRKEYMQTPQVDDEDDLIDPDDGEHLLRRRNDSFEVVYRGSSCAC